MAIDICQACGCCNHCGSRHDEGSLTDEARCPLDPDVTQEEVAQILRDQGVSDEEQARSWSTCEKLVEQATEIAKLQERVASLQTEMQRTADVERELCARTVEAVLSDHGRARIVAAAIRQRVGVGGVRLGQRPNEEALEGYVETCKNCEGQGVVAEETCPACEGAGVV